MTEEHVHEPADYEVEAEEEIEEVIRESLIKCESSSRFKDLPQRFSGDQIASRGVKSKAETA